MNEFKITHLFLITILFFLLLYFFNYSNEYTGGGIFFKFSYLIFEILTFFYNYIYFFDTHLNLFQINLNNYLLFIYINYFQSPINNLP